MRFRSSGYLRALLAHQDCGMTYRLTSTSYCEICGAEPWLTSQGKVYLFPIMKVTVLGAFLPTVTDRSQVFGSVNKGRCTVRSVSTSKACSLPASPHPSCHATI